MKNLRIKERTHNALLLFLFAAATIAGCGDAPVDDIPIDGPPLDESEVCCKLPDGTIASETSSDCEEAGGTQVEDELCHCDEEVCCETADGTFQTLPESQCDNIASPDRCVDVEPGGEVCCKTADGYLTLPDGECPETQIVAADMCIEDEEVCCETATGYQTLPASECPDGQTVAADMCIDEAEEVCCRVDDQFVSIPADQCPDYALAPADMCVDEAEELCCRIDGQYVTVTADQCPADAQVPADMCIEDTEVCCETPNGLMTLPSSDCPDGQEVAADMCVDDAEICCMTAAGPAYVPSSQCEPMSVLTDDRCVAIEPAKECVKFRAVDMSTLPYTTTDGDTLQSFNSFWGTFPVQTGWSSGCLDQPATAERAFVGVGNDLVLNFAAPVSSIYLLRYHAQVGDDLEIPGANLTQTFCGADNYNNITKVDFPTPSSTVTVQDLSPDGGSGYSVLLAECIEWAEN